MIPNLSGFELYKTFQSLSQASFIPILMISGGPEDPKANYEELREPGDEWIFLKATEFSKTEACHNGLAAKDDSGTSGTRMTQVTSAPETAGNGCQRKAR